MTKPRQDKGTKFRQEVSLGESGLYKGEGGGEILSKARVVKRLRSLGVILLIRRIQIDKNKYF